MTFKKNYLMLVLIAGVFYSCKSSDGPKKARLSNSALGESSMYFSDKDNSLYKSVISSHEIGTNEQSQLEIETGKAIESQQGGAISLPNEAGAQAGTSSSSSSSSKPQTTVQVTPIDSSQVDTSLFPKCSIAKLPVTNVPKIGETVLLTVSCDKENAHKMTYSWFDENMKKIGEGKTFLAKESVAGLKRYKVYSSYNYTDQMGYLQVEYIDLTWKGSESLSEKKDISIKLYCKSESDRKYELSHNSIAYYKRFRVALIGVDTIKELQTREPFHFYHSACDSNGVCREKNNSTYKTVYHERKLSDDKKFYITEKVTHYFLKSNGKQCFEEELIDLKTIESGKISLQKCNLKNAYILTRVSNSYSNINDFLQTYNYYNESEKMEEINNLEEASKGNVNLYILVIIPEGMEKKGPYAPMVGMAAGGYFYDYGFSKHISATKSCLGGREASFLSGYRSR